MKKNIQLSIITPTLNNHKDIRKFLLSIKKQTKIVATIGSASQEIEVLTELVKNGLDVARMNMSHGDHAEHGRKIDNVREVNKKLNSNVAVLVDLAGPKIRIGDLQTETVELVEGKKIIFSSNRRLSNDSDKKPKFEIYQMNADGTCLKRLTDGPGANILPSFSPDGKKISYTSNRTGKSQIYVMDYNEPKDCLPDLP
jgi:hypothetical protein